MARQYLCSGFWLLGPLGLRTGQRIGDLNPVRAPQAAGRVPTRTSGKRAIVPRSNIAERLRILVKGWMNVTGTRFSLSEQQFIDQRK